MKFATHDLYGEYMHMTYWFEDFEDGKWGFILNDSVLPTHF